jgi:polyferredoxin
MVEEAFSVFLGVLILAWFLGDLAIWLFPLRGHPWRRKVLLQLLFLLPIFLYIVMFLLWKPFEKAEPTFREFYLSYAMLVLFFTGMLSAFLWLSSSGGIFFWTFYFYLIS